MDMLAKAPTTICLTKVTLAEGTTSTLSTTGTTTYIINSQFYTKAALTNEATPTTDYATGLAFIPIPIPGTTANLPPSVPNSANGYVCAFLVGFNAAGTLCAIQGPISPLDVSGNPVGGVQLPSDLGPGGASNTNANNFCPIGMIAVKAGSTAVATFTFGTTSWTTTGITTCLLDLADLPARPLTSLTFT